MKPTIQSKRKPHWTQDPDRCTTCEFRYEVVLNEKDGRCIDGSFERSKSAAFAAGEWFVRQSKHDVFVFDRMARIRAPYGWQFDIEKRVWNVIQHRAR